MPQPPLPPIGAEVPAELQSPPLPPIGAEVPAELQTSPRPRVLPLPPIGAEVPAEMQVEPPPRSGTSVTGGPAALGAASASETLTPDELQVIAGSPATQAFQAPSYGPVPVQAPPSTWIDPSLTPAADLGLTFPIEAAKQAVSGAAVLASRVAAPLQLPELTGQAMQRGENATPPARIGAGQPPAWSVKDWTDETKTAATDVLAGLMGAGAAPAVAAGFVTAPVHALLTGGAIWMAGASAGKLAELAQGSPVDRRLAQTLAEALVAFGGAKLLVDNLDAAAASVATAAKAAARPRVLAGALRVNPPAAGRASGYGPGDVPGYRAEQVTPGSEARVTEVQPSPESLRLEDELRQAGRAAEVRGKESGAIEDEGRDIVRLIDEALARDRTPVTGEVTPAPLPPIGSEVPPVAPTTAPAPRPTYNRAADQFEVTVPPKAPSPQPEAPSAEPDGAALQQYVDAIELDRTRSEKLGVRSNPTAAVLSVLDARGMDPALQGERAQVILDTIAASDASLTDALQRTDRETKAVGESMRESLTPPPPPLPPIGAEVPAAPTSVVPRGTASTTIPEGSADAAERQDQSTSPAGPRREDARPERGAPNESGPSARGSEGDRAPRGGLPPEPDKTKYDGLTFVRQPVAQAQTRLTPEVRRELGRMQEELDTFPFTEATWTDLSHEHGLHGNVAGGHMNKIPASGGAPVYDDILSEAPLATPRKGKDGKPHVARKVSGGRGDVREAIRRVLAASDIHNHLAEGAVRVAERRAAGDYHGLSAPWLPPSWDTGTTSDEIPADLDALIDELAAAEGITTEKADTLDTGEEQPRLPEAGRARQVGKADTSFKAPVQASSQDFSLTPAGAEASPDTAPDLFAADLDALRNDEEPQFSRTDDSDRRYVRQSNPRPWSDGRGTIVRAAFGDYLKDPGTIDVSPLEQSAAFLRVAKAIRRVLNEILPVFPEADKALTVRGFLFEHGAYGLHINLRRGTERTDGILINPLEPLLRYPTPDNAAEMIIEAILHEITHVYVPDEGPEFIAIMGELHGALGAKRHARAARLLQEAYRGGSIVNRRTLAKDLADVLRGYEAARRRGADPNVPRGGSHNYSRQPPNRSGEQSGLPAGTGRDSKTTLGLTANRDDPQFSRGDQPVLSQNERDRIHAEARAEQRALRQAYATMPTVRLGGRTVPVYDTGKRLSPAERNQLLQQPDVRRLFTVITEATDAVLAALLDEPTGVERVGILLDAAAYGVFFPKPSTPSAGTKQVATILINPFEPMRGDVGPLVAAATTYTTIVHEATHWFVKGHDVDFLMAYDAHLARLADSPVHVRAFQQLWEAYADITRTRAFRPGLVQAFSSYSTSRRRRGTPGDALGRAAGYEQRPTDDAGGPRDAPREARRDRSAAPRTVTDAELQQLADRLDTTVAVQRARAEAAGYTIRAAAQPVAQASVVPGASAFIERDLTPGFQAAFKEAGEARSGILATWAPGMASPEAETMGAIMRPNLALRRQRTARAQRALRKLEVAWDKQPQAAQRAFAMAVDEGRVDDLPAWQRDLAQVLTEINTKKRHEANALGGKVGYIKDYYPREWVQPGKVRAFLMRAIYGKRPLQGRAGFKKARSRDKETGEPFTFRQMIGAGFEPVSDNPITAHLRKWLEMDKWIAARRILLEGKRFGVATFVKIGDEPPEGQIRYPESFGTVYAPPVVTVQEAYDERLMQALHAFAESLGVKTVRRVKVGGTRWGYAVGDSQIVTKFAGPETVLEHEIGHILDERYGLRAQWVKNKLMTKELRALADLRFEGSEGADVPASFRRYVRKGPEKIANLVHAFLYNPDLAKKVAPNAYWALYNLAKDTPALHPLLTLQATKSLVLGTAGSEVAVGGLVIKGYYYGPPDAVRLLANHLSPGLRGHALFNLYRRAGNLLNQVQLGLSAFHFVLTSLDQVIGKTGMALEHVARGQFKEAGKKALMAPVAPLIDVVRGDRLLKQFYAKDATFRTLTGVADGVARGGGGVGWDTFWHDSAPERFLQAFRGAVAEAKAGNYPGAALRTATLPWRAVLAAVELQAKPIMEWWVPRLKLAAYWDLYRMELQDLGEKPDEIELRKVAGRAWDSVDNWLGELIYDNLFWNAILKDSGMASVRALGWNVGTVRGAIGAVPRQLRQLGAMPGAGAGGSGLGKPPMRLRHTGNEPDPEGGPDIPIYELGRAPWLVHDFARLLAAFFWVAVYGALYQYLHTGKKPGEEDDGHVDRTKIALDLYFPRTGAFRSDGQPVRASLPSYVKELYAFAKHPIETAVHKAHPLGSLTYDVVVKNEDYFGTDIRNSDDPWVQQAHDLFTFIADQYQPISVRTFQQRRTQRGGTGISGAESFFGVGVAPQTVTQSDAEEYLRSIAPPTHRTKEQAVQAQGRRDLRAARQAGDVAAAQTAIEEGHLSARSIQLTAKSSRQSAIVRSFEPVTLPQGIKAYELATPEERAQLQRPLVQKWHNNFKNVAPADKAALAARFSAAMKLPVTRATPAAAAR